MRVGHGYDVHRLVDERKLILGGVNIPYVKGLLGHSDADVLTHAIIDALLGAISFGDIGELFPDNDDTYKDADSIELLKIVIQKVYSIGYKIVNIDCTIIAQKPKIKPYINQMKDVISKTCKINTFDINIKATTEEGLGFTGSEEGIAAHAVCLLQSQSY